jgi:anti-sigma regulatory factor (Ser/Thr protein kinase)
MRRELVAWLSQVQVGAGITDEIILATHEAAANAIEHARMGTEVTIRGVRDESNVVIVVANHGRWKEPRSLDEMRGRGLTVMKQLMSDLEIQVRSKRTVVRMRRDLSVSPTGMQGDRVAGSSSHARSAGSTP